LRARLSSSNAEAASWFKGDEVRKFRKELVRWKLLCARYAAAFDEGGFPRDFKRLT
jgi:hypothetical protein